MARSVLKNFLNTQSTASTFKGIEIEHFLPLVSKSLKRLRFGSSFANSELTTDIEKFSKVRSMPLISEAERKERLHYNTIQ